MPRTNIPLETLQAEAAQRGYLVTRSGTDISAAKKQFAHVHTRISLTDFDLDPQRAEEYAFLSIYYWIRGYHLNSGDDGTFELQRGMLHPHFDPQIRVAETFDYHWDADWDLGHLHQAMLQWVEQVEQPGKEGDTEPPRTRTLKIDGTPRTYLV